MLATQNRYGKMIATMLCGDRTAPRIANMIHSDDATMKRKTRDCVEQLLACMRDKAPMRRDRMARASGLKAEELTRALKAARQMGVIDRDADSADAPANEAMYVLTGTPLPAARRSSPANPVPTASFQPLLDAWGIARPLRPGRPGVVYGGYGER